MKRKTTVNWKCQVDKVLEGLYYTKKGILRFILNYVVEEVRETL